MLIVVVHRRAKLQMPIFAAARLRCVRNELSVGL
jgi:hypothetical protein